MAYNEREEEMNEWEEDELPKGEIRTTYSFLLRNHQNQKEYKYWKGINCWYVEDTY